MSVFPDIGCDLWIIREWQTEQCWRNASDDARGKMLAEQLDDEQAGYGLPEDYTAGKRLHVFGDEVCEVWFGCMNGQWLAPEDVCSLLALMIGDPDMASCVALDGAYVVTLDGRNVTGAYRSEVRHGAA